MPGKVRGRLLFPLEGKVGGKDLRVVAHAMERESFFPDVHERCPGRALAQQDLGDFENLGLQPVRGVGRVVHYVLTCKVAVAARGGLRIEQAVRADARAVTRLSGAMRVLLAHCSAKGACG